MDNIVMVMNRDLLKAAQPDFVSKRNMRPHALKISIILTLIVISGLCLVRPQYEASVLMSFEPTQVKNDWDLLMDETRNIDFEGQIRSRTVLAPVMKELGLTDRPGSSLKRSGFDRYFSEKKSSPEQITAGVIEKFQPHLTVERIRHSALLRISVKLPSPETAYNAANAIGDSFLNLKRQQFLQRAQEKLDAIEHEIKETQDDLANLMNKRNAFFKENGWDDYELELAPATKRVTALKQNLARFDAYITAYSPEGATLASQNHLALLSSEDGTLNQLSQKVSELEARYLQVKSRYKEDSPPVMQISREKMDLEKAILNYIKDQKVLLSSQLDTAQDKLQKLFDAGPKVQNFQGAIDHAEKRYQDLLDQRSAVRLQMASAQEQGSKSFGDLRLLDQAVLPQAKALWQRSAKIVMTGAATFLISFCLLMIMFELWYQVLQIPSRQIKQTNNPFDKSL